MSPVVDVHSHFFPPDLGDFAVSTGDTRWPSLEIAERSRIMCGSSVFRKVSRSCFDVDQRINDLDQAGVAHQVLSPVPITLVDWAPAAAAAQFHRAQNIGLAHAAAASGGRLSAMGGVPMQDIEQAILGLRHSVEIGLVGVEIAAFPGGRELDDPELRAFWAAATDLGLPVFVHPAHQKTATRRSGQPHEFGIGMLTDTALAASALVYGGVLADFPTLRVALAHGCGTFAWAQPRLQFFVGLTEPEPESFEALTKRLWVDALVFDPTHLQLLAHRFGADHVMLGTDHPFLPGGMQARIAELEQAAGTPDILPNALGANALNLFDRQIQLGDNLT